MQNVSNRKLPRSRGTISFARIMANANEDDFPLADLEPDSGLDDSDDGLEDFSPPPYTLDLDMIAEEDEGSDDGFVHIVDLETPKYCHDPHCVGHPVCHGRQKMEFYGCNAVDAEQEFQERFVATHYGKSSITHYREWRTAKWEDGSVTPHGYSALRNEVLFEDESEVDHGALVKPIYKDETLKHLETENEDFVDHYLQLQQARRMAVTHAVYPGAEMFDNVVSEEDTTSLPPATSTPESATVEANIQFVNSFTHTSTADGASLRTSVFSKRPSVTTKPSNESVDFEYPRLLDILDLETTTHMCSTTWSNCLRGFSISKSTRHDPHARSNDKRIVSLPVFPVHIDTTVDDCSTTVEDLVPPVPTSHPESPPATGDQQEDVSIATMEYQSPSAISWIEDVPQSWDQQPYSSLFDNVRPETRRRLVSKLGSKIKTAPGATKQAAQRFIRSTKKLGKTVRCFTLVAVAAHNPCGTVTLV